jgi:protein-L-isoaspartate(D-aspartate) O-methyltransferase
MSDYAAARLKMVESQVRPNKVSDPALLEALLSVPRELFAPEHLRGLAYIDEDIPIGDGRYLMEPMVLARLLQTAAIAPEDRVLEIGGGTGYGAAVLALLARSVVLLETPALAARARAALAQAGAANVGVREGKLEAGCKERAPYDVIVFGGAITRIPEAVTAQLAEGGRLVAVVKDAPGMGKATLATKARGIVSRRVVFDAGTMLLPGFAPEASFVF